MTLRHWRPAKLVWLIVKALLKARLSHFHVCPEGCQYHLHLVNAERANDLVKLFLDTFVMFILAFRIFSTTSLLRRHDL